MKLDALPERICYSSGCPKQGHMDHECHICCFRGIQDQRDSNGCTHICQLSQWWNYHCQEWYHLKNKDGMPAVIAMEVNSREVYGSRYPGRWTEWSHQSFFTFYLGTYENSWVGLLWEVVARRMRDSGQRRPLHAGPCWLAKCWKSLQDTGKVRVFLSFCHSR